MIALVPILVLFAWHCSGSSSAGVGEGAVKG